MPRTGLRSLLLSVFAIVTACGSASVAPNDLGSNAPWDSGRPPTLCEAFCTTASNCYRARTQTEIGGEFGVAHCETSPSGIEACLQECEDKETALESGFSRCVTCSMDCAADCNSACNNQPLVDEVRYDLTAAQTCWIDDRPSESCSQEHAPLRLTVLHNGSEHVLSTYTGTVTVVSQAPLVLSVPNGDTYEVQATAAQLPSFGLGEVVDLQVDLECGWYCDRSIVLRDTTGTLLFAAWAGPTAKPRLAEITFEYEASACLGVRDQQISRIDLDLVLSDGTRIPVGGQHETGNLRVLNGRSEVRYAVTVTDTSPSSRSGAIERR